MTFHAKQDTMPDEHRYEPRLDWGRPNAEELRNRRLRIAGTLEGPYAKPPGRFERLCRAIASLFGVQ